MSGLDQRLCLAGSWYLADWLNAPSESVSVLGVPENDPAVPEDRRIELVVQIGTRRVAWEHTLVESYENQIGNAKQLDQFIRAVEAEITTPLPGRCQVAIQTTAAAGLKRNKGRSAAKAVAEKLMEGLRPGVEGIVRLDVEGFESMYVSFRRGVPPSLTYARFKPDDLDGRLRARLGKAFSDKLPKLSRWREDGFKTGLVLEFQDFSLFDAGSLAGTASQAMETHRGREPNWILVTETLPESPSYWWLLFEGDHWLGPGESPDMPINVPGVLPPIATA